MGSNVLFLFFFSRGQRKKRRQALSSHAKISVGYVGVRIKSWDCDSWISDLVVVRFLFHLFFPLLVVEEISVLSFLGNGSLARRYLYVFFETCFFFGFSCLVLSSS